MTLTIELSPDEEARLREQARQRGEDAEAVARGFVQAGLNTSRVEGASREAFLQYLLEKGDIPFIPPGLFGPPPPLVSVRGEPISETIIRERG